MSILVEFHGVRYWYLGSSLNDLDHALAPLEDCDEDGKVITLADSFAHVCQDGVIRRYRRAIGTVIDIKQITRIIEHEPSSSPISPR